MGIWEEVTRRLPAVLHGVMTILAIPYMLLAILFLMVDHVASQRGLWAILNAFLDSFNWTMTWGLLLLSVSLITVFGMGFIEPLRWWAALALAGMISAALGIILFYRAAIPTFDELVFLSPAFLVLAASCWALVQRS